MRYGYVLLTIVLTVVGQLAVKWQMSRAGGLPDGLTAKVGFLLRMLVNPWIIAAFAAAFLAALAWMAALTKFSLSVAYPFMSLSFVLVTALSAVFFREPVTIYKIVGMVLILLGLLVTSRSTT